MLKGGHGEENIKYLKKNHLSFNVDTTYSNGVRAGHIDKHARPKERLKDGHLWFPKNWSATKIKKAGEFVANLKKNSKIKDHKQMHGKYGKVYVVTYKSKNEICGICPAYENLDEKKGEIMKKN